MKFSSAICVVIILAPWHCCSTSVSVEEDSTIKVPAAESPKKKANTGRSLVAVNEQSQERSSSRFFGPALSGYPGMYPGPMYPHSAPFQGGFGYGGYPGGHAGYPGGQAGYPGGHLGYPGGFAGYPGSFPQYPSYGAFSGNNGFGYGVQQQQQQQLQGGGYSTGAFVG